jgi:hypothetical protein
MIYKWNERAKYVLFFGFLFLFILPFIVLVITKLRMGEIDMWANFSYAEMVIPQYDNSQQSNILIYKTMLEYSESFFNRIIGKFWYVVTVIALAYAYLKDG